MTYDPNEEKHIRHIGELLRKLAEGSISVAEKEELDRWADTSPRTKEITEKALQKKISRHDAERFASGNDANQAWSALQTRLADRRKPRRTALRYAAAILITGLVAGFAFWALREQPAQVVQAIHSPIASPILELPDGRLIDLGSGETGEPEILSRLGAAREGVSLIYNDADGVEAHIHRLSVPRGGLFDLTLADGTRVWLNSGTVLCFPNRFTDGERRVQVSGEAYFEVAHCADTPFIVETDDLTVRVTGTRFNVRAYPEDDSSEVALAQGGVSVFTVADQVALTPGQLAVLHKADGKLEAMDADISSYTSWMHGLFQFKSAPLRDIARQLERWYDVEIIFTNDDIANTRFTGAVRKEDPANYILDMIKQTKPFDYRIEGKTIILTAK